MEVFAFLTVTLLLIVVEWSLSVLLRFYVSIELAADIFAAMIIVFIGLFVSYSGWFKSFYFSSAKKAGASNMDAYIASGENIKAFGEAMQTTFGIPAVVTAIISYFIIKGLVNLRT